MTPVSPSYTLTLLVDNKPIEFELDTEANVSIRPEELWNCSHSDEGLCSSTLQLCKLTDEPLNVIGEALVRVQHGKADINETLISVENGSTALLGRNWIQSMNLDCNSLLRVHE